MLCARISFRIASASRGGVETAAVRFPPCSPTPFDKLSMRKAPPTKQAAPWTGMRGLSVSYVTPRADCSLCDPAAVDRQCGAGHRGRALAAQEHGKLADL